MKSQNQKKKAYYASEIGRIFVVDDLLKRKDHLLTTVVASKNFNHFNVRSTYLRLFILLNILLFYSQSQYSKTDIIYSLIRTMYFIVLIFDF